MSRRRRAKRSAASSHEAGAQHELPPRDALEPTCHGVVLTKIDGTWQLIEVSLTPEQLEAVETKRHKTEFRSLLVERGATVLGGIVRRAREGR